MSRSSIGKAITTSLYEKFSGIDRKDFIEKTRLIKKWINKIDDNRLMFSDDLDMYY